MTKRINGDLYSDLITSADNRVMACGGYARTKIDRIVIHHNATTNNQAAINTWVKALGGNTSAHYQIANNQIIGIVGEETCAWHAGTQAMNQRSIGIENLNSTMAPKWEIGSATFENLARLVADICKRYGFKPDATHVIPHSQNYATVCPGGIDMNKLRKRAMEIYNGGKITSEPMPPKKDANKPTPTPTNDVDYMRKDGIVVWNNKWFDINETATVSGLKQVFSNELAGYKSKNKATMEAWLNNGIPVSGINRKGNKLQFKQNTMTIVQYDKPSNGIAIMVGGYKVWVDATVARKA